MKNAILGILFIFLLSGTLMAITGASVSGIIRTRWDGSVSSQNVSTQGGNITAVNVNSAQLTSKWASYYGNVTGSIRLSDAATGNAVFTWTYSTSAGGEVCVSQNTSQLFTSPVDANETNIDTVFSTSGTPDNASATLNTTCPTLSLSTGALTGFNASKTQSSSTFTTCAATFASGNLSVAGTYGFCTSINASGTNYIGSSANYELIVPTSAGANQYYFYVELS